MRPPDHDPTPDPQARDATIHPFARAFDPDGAEAEDQYDAVVRRVNRSRARSLRLRRQLERLAAPFVEGTPSEPSDRPRDAPLTPKGRRRRLARLVDVGVALRQAEAEEAFACETLDRMNRALDRWARDTYGG